jgi:hypothetical protein
VKCLISLRKISVQMIDSSHILSAVRNYEGYKATTSHTSSGTVHIALWTGSKQSARTFTRLAQQRRQCCILKSRFRRQRTHAVPTVKIKWLRLNREITAVYSEYQKTYLNMLCEQKFRDLSKWYVELPLGFKWLICKQGGEKMKINKRNECITEIT